MNITSFTFRYKREYRNAIIKHQDVRPGKYKEEW